MTLQCDIVIDPSVEFAQPELLADLLQQAAESEPFLAASSWQMSLRLSTDVTIAEMHARFFSDPTPTDVITFPSGETPDDGGAYLGDVVVSVETAAQQAVDGHHSPAREVAFLALHGLLHLSGYTDETIDQRAAMHQRQLLLLENWERDRGRLW